MDSSGIGVIIGRYKKLKSGGRRMYVANPNRQIDKVMSLSGLYSIIKKL
jgi:stage II sporulation protein AA (anti-sigma F factor antagonist)